MTNKQSLLTFITILMSIMFFLLQSFSSATMVSVWLMLLVYLLTKMKNHFITLLLILEMLSLSSIFMMSLMSQSMNSISLMFILMTLSVGEAVLGLAILVKLVRWSSTEFMMSGIN